MIDVSVWDLVLLALTRDTLMKQRVVKKQITRTRKNLMKAYDRFRDAHVCRLMGEFYPVRNRGKYGAFRRLSPGDARRLRRESPEEAFALLDSVRKSP